MRPLLPLWERMNRAARFAEYWWRGADLRRGGPFHRWVWGYTDDPMVPSRRDRKAAEKRERENPKV